MSNDDEVGYGKPPKGSQFRKGHSGNPRGRPKGTKNLKTDLQEVLQERIVIVEGDERKTVSKQRGFVMTLANNAVRGDTKAGLLLANLIVRHADQSDAGNDEEPLADDDLAIIESFSNRNLESAPRVTDEPSGNDDGDHDADAAPSEEDSNE